MTYDDKLAVMKKVADHIDALVKKDSKLAVVALNTEDSEADGFAVHIVIRYDSSTFKGIT